MRDECTLTAGSMHPECGCIRRTPQPTRKTVLELSPVAGQLGQVRPTSEASLRRRPPTAVGRLQRKVTPTLTGRHRPRRPPAERNARTHATAWSRGREGERSSGSCLRLVRPLAAPLSCSADVVGPAKPEEAGKAPLASVRVANSLDRPAAGARWRCRLAAPSQKKIPSRRLRRARLPEVEAGIHQSASVFFPIQ